MSMGASAPIRRSFNRALLAILCLGLVLVLTLTALLPLEGPFGLVLALFPINVLIYLGAGLLAWYHRPSNRMGALILLTGVWVFLGGAGNTDVPALVWLGTIAGSMPLAGFVHLLLAFPAGRVRGRISRMTVMVAYGTSLLLEAPSYLFVANPGVPGLAIADAPELARWGGIVQEAVGFVVLASTLVLLTHRLRRSSTTERRVLVPLYGYGIAAVVVMLFAARILRPVFAWAPQDVAALQLLMFCGVPIVFALGVLRGGVARTGELEELGVWLGEAGRTKPEIGAALARTLGDPTLEVWFWVPGRNGYVDTEGVEVTAAREQASRGLEPVELDGRRIGAISCDIALMAEPELVRTAGRVVAIALDRERLIAELLASGRALQSSRERLVEVADRERRRIAQDLHDGLQVQLVLLALEAQQIANAGDDGDAVQERATELRKGIDTAAAGLREVVHSVMPAALTQRGLSAAAEDLVDRMPVPTTLTLSISDNECSPVVESTAYFVVAEALANAVKHSRAGAIAVQLSRAGNVLHVEVRDNGDGGAREGRGSGLTGMVERVEALGGRVHIESASGAGTTIRAEIPCGL
ncbi:sensor histidine kinase [Microbacterium sp. A93]|uniref:sensor histidine kinase n=1 Tax=Microbacterium sp. A93 TaxID=3450716 RepID=UPI003F43E6BC